MIMVPKTEKLSKFDSSENGFVEWAPVSFVCCHENSLTPHAHVHRKVFSVEM